ncbi:putative Ras GTPase-activating protein, partial [Caerostris extrusa]
MCFWGEYFEFNNLPTVTSIYVNLYREADKKKRRDKNVLIGCVQIPVKCKWKTFAGEVVPCYDRKEQQWKRLSFHPNQISFQTVEYVKSNYKILCEMLEPAISVKCKVNSQKSFGEVERLDTVARAPNDKFRSGHIEMLQVRFALLVFALPVSSISS